MQLIARLPVLGFVNDLLIVLHLHQMSLINQDLLSLLFRRFHFELLRLIRRLLLLLADNEVIDLWKDLHISSVVHDDDVIIVVVAVILMNRCLLVMMVLLLPT